MCIVIKYSNHNIESLLLLFISVMCFKSERKLIRTGFLFHIIAYKHRSQYIRELVSVASFKVENLYLFYGRQFNVLCVCKSSLQLPAFKKKNECERMNHIAINASAA